MSYESLGPVLEALALRSGYNAALVGIGAALLGLAAGAAGTFLYLRKRSLASDAVAHATLPGVAGAFLFMVAMGGDGRNLPGLLLGSALSGWLGLMAVDWITRRTRLSEDAAIGAVLSVFFGLGVVLMTVVQTLPAGRQAGLSSFLIGSTAGMLFADALVITLAAAIVGAVAFALRRPLALVAFDPQFAAATGINLARMDRALMALVLLVTVIGLKLVGLVLIVALLIIPPVTARLWTDRIDHMTAISALVGAVSGYVGSALSAALPSTPTGPAIVLVACALFAGSLLVAPSRGLLPALLRRRTRLEA